MTHMKWLLFLLGIQSCPVETPWMLGLPRALQRGDRSDRCSPLSSSRLLQPQVWHPLVGQLLRRQADYFRMSSSVPQVQGRRYTYWGQVIPKYLSIPITYGTRPVAEVSIIGNYRRGQLSSCVDAEGTRSWGTGGWGSESLSLYLSIFSIFHLSTISCLYMSISIILSIFHCLSLSYHLSICLSVYLSVFLSSYLSFYLLLSSYLSIYYQLFYLF